MKKVDHIIHAKWLIANDTMSVLENHALAIRGSKIIDILPSSEIQKKYQAENIQNYAEHAVLPGFINAHTHTPMNIFKGLADDLELMDWLTNHIWPAEGKYLSYEFVYDASLLAIGEMIRGGTTCFNDMYFFMNATAEASLLAGIRAYIGLHIIDVPTAWSHSPEEDFEKALSFYHAYKDKSLLGMVMSPHSTYTVSEANLIRAYQTAEQYNLKMNIHLQESAAEINQFYKNTGERPLQYLHKRELVSDRLIAIHMTQLDEKDFEILQEKKPSIIHCPESNMKLASGICPIDTLTELGINVGLGTDGAASNNDLDMIGEMRSCAFLGKVRNLNPKAASAETVLKMATINGAKALGIEDHTGSLTIGKEADFIAINLNELETQPIYHPISQIVYAASRQQVTDVWVSGKQLLKNRQLMTLEEDDLLNKAKIWRKKIKK